MSENTQQTAPSTPSTPSAMQEFAREIATAIRDTGDKKKVTVAQLVRRSVFNPKGRSRKQRKLDRVMYQNGGRLLVTRLHDEEISLLNQLQPGKFVNDLVEVRAHDNGNVHIHYNNKRDHMLTLKGECKNFTELLRRCVNEAKEQQSLTRARP